MHEKVDVVAFAVEFPQLCAEALAHVAHDLLAACQHLAVEGFTPRDWDWDWDWDGCRWDSTPHDPVTRVRFQGVGHVKVNQHRAVVGKVKTVSVKRRAASGSSC